MQGVCSTATRPASLKISLTCELAEVRSATRAVREFLSEQGWRDGELMSLELAFVEACNNAIKYCPENARGLPIEVESICHDSGTELRVSDHTRGFDWPKKIELPDPESESGRGLFLITSVMDSAGYFRGQGENLLIMRKARTGGRPALAMPGGESRERLKASLADSERVISKLVEEQLKQRLMVHELEIARKIQRSLLVKTMPQLPGYTLAGFCLSAHEVGGDFYDVINAGEDCLLLVIADVMGTGIPAAMFAAMLRTLLRAAPELSRQPAALLSRVNRLLHPELSAVDMFITAQLALVDPRRGKIVAANAGHCPLAVANGVRVNTFSPEGMPLGILPDSRFCDEVIALPRNGLVLLYTDGLTEALNARGEQFGQQRLLDWLKQCAAARRTAQELKQDLAGQLEQHRSDGVLTDDQAFLIMAG